MASIKEDFFPVYIWLNFYIFNVIMVVCIKNIENTLVASVCDQIMR